MGEGEQTEIAVLKLEVATLKSQLAEVKSDVKEKFDRIEVKLDQALRGRPTWAVAIIISLLLTVTSSLTVYVIAH
jgi:hypothetical protein